MSPLQRTIRELKDQGMVCAITEKWNPHARIRQDLFGIIDLIALDPSRGVVGIQACGSDYAAHHKKLTGECAQRCVDWLVTPGTALEVWSWTKVLVKRGGKAKIWRPRVVDYTLADFIDPLQM